MRFMITAAPDPNKPADAEAPAVSDEMIAAYMRFNEEMAQAGVLVVSEGLNPERKGARVGIRNGERAVLDGPFAESKELVGGFYLIEVGSLDEAIQWALKCPTGLGSDDILTVHPMTDAGDLPPEMMDLIRREAPTWVSSWAKD